MINSVSNAEKANRRSRVEALIDHFANRWADEYPALAARRRFSPASLTEVARDSGALANRLEERLDDEQFWMDADADRTPSRRTRLNLIVALRITDYVHADESDPFAGLI